MLDINNKFINKYYVTTNITKQTTTYNNRNIYKPNPPTPPQIKIPTRYRIKTRH